MKFKRLRLWYLSVGYALFLLIIVIGWSMLKQFAYNVNTKDESKTIKKPVMITFWSLFEGGDGKYADSIVNNFNNSQNEIIVTPVRLSWNEYYSRLGTALLAGKGPDVAVCHVDRLSPFVNAGLITNIDSISDKVKLNYNDFSENNEKSVTFNGKHYAVPLDTHFLVMYYNIKLLKNAGLLNNDNTPNLINNSPEGFIQFLMKIKKSNPGIVPLSINTPHMDEPFYNMYYEAGGNILRKDGKVAIDKEKAVKIMKYFLKLSEMNLININDLNPFDTFNNGKSAIWWGGVWEAAQHFGDRVNVKACVPIPAIFGSYTHAAGSHTLVIPEYVDANRKEAALKFAKYYALEGGKLWGKAGHVPAAKAIVNSYYYRNLPYRKYFLKALKTIKFSPKTDKWNAIDTAIKEGIQIIIQRKVSPEKGVDKIIQSVNDILEK